MKNSTRVIINGNNLTDKGAMCLIGAIKDDLQELNLAMNPKISKKSYDLLADRIKTDFGNLTILDLQSNKIGDDSASLICDELCQLRGLSVLNLSHNHLTDACAKYISELLIYSKHLGTLILSWNKFKIDGAVELAEVIKDNENLRILDLSFNSLGSQTNVSQTTAYKQLLNQSVEFDEFPLPKGSPLSPTKLNPVPAQTVGAVLGEMFRMNTRLVHVDIS
jgi:Leucine-rich repeat (LRR) protein